MADHSFGALILVSPFAVELCRVEPIGLGGSLPGHRADPFLFACFFADQRVIIRILVVTAVSYGYRSTRWRCRARAGARINSAAAAGSPRWSARCPCCRDIRDAHTRRIRSTAQQGVDPLQREVLPRVASAMFSTLMLAGLSCVVTAVLAYVSVYGFTTGAFAGYTRTFGHVFNPAVSMIFALKVFFFGLAVALIPIASVLYDRSRARLRTSVELQSLVRIFVVILLIEVASLVGNYY